jgi:hypothetical protein
MLVYHKKYEIFMTVGVKNFTLQGYDAVYFGRMYVLIVHTSLFFLLSFVVLPSSTYTVGAEIFSFLWFLLITFTYTPQSVGLLWTMDRPLAEISTWQRTNTYKRQTSMPPLGFETTIPASARPQSYAWDRVATGIGIIIIIIIIKIIQNIPF